MNKIIIAVVTVLVVGIGVVFMGIPKERSLPNLAAKLAACKAFPNNSTQHVVETTRLFINTLKDMYPDKNISSNSENAFETVRGNATAGYISNGGLPGEAYEATPECWSTYIEFDGSGEVDLKVKSAVKDVPDYFVHFVVRTNP